MASEEAIAERRAKEKAFVISREWRRNGQWYCCLIHPEEKRTALIIDITVVRGGKIHDPTRGKIDIPDTDLFKDIKDEACVVFVAFDVTPWTYGSSLPAEGWVPLDELFEMGWWVD